VGAQAPQVEQRAQRALRVGMAEEVEAVARRMGRAVQVRRASSSLLTSSTSKAVRELGLTSSALESREEGRADEMAELNGVRLAEQPEVVNGKERKMKLKEALSNMLGSIVTQLTPTIAGAVKALLFLALGALGGPTATQMVMPAADKPQPLALASLPQAPPQVRTVETQRLMMDPALKAQLEELVVRLRAEAAAKAEAERVAKEAGAKRVAEGVRKVKALEKKAEECGGWFNPCMKR